LTDTQEKIMSGVYLTGYGGFDMLQWRKDIPVPTLASDEVLIRVGAAGVNNTDINTRIGWYSKTVTGDTDSGIEAGFDVAADDSASWSGDAFQFPRIQGADVAGEIVGVGESVDNARLGERVIVRTMQANTRDDSDTVCATMGSEMDGGFAQYTKIASVHALAINCDWSYAELASLPCAYSTAEAMLQRVDVSAGEKVLITGASGGVGSAAVQLAKRRGAEVIAICGATKTEAVAQIGADQVLPRGCDLTAELGHESIDVVVDLVAGDAWPCLLEVLKRGGRYVTSGAIAGPIVELDVRTLYLKDLSLLGSTYQPDSIMQDLVGYVERDEIKPLVAKTFALKDIVDAQTEFLAKNHVGKLVLIP